MNGLGIKKRRVKCRCRATIVVTTSDVNYGTAVYINDIVRENDTSGPDYRDVIDLNRK